MKQPKFMIVRWLDAASEDQWKDAGEPPVELATCWTCGWFKRETDEELVLAQSITDDGGYAHDWAIHAHTIKKRRIIKVELP